MAESILTIEGISKYYGKVAAVQNLSLEVNRGAVFGILGPNGSGKSTTLGMVLGAVNPTSGTFAWFGNTKSNEARKRIGAIIETPCFYHYLNARQNLAIVATIKSVAKERIDLVLDRVGLLDRSQDPFKTFSLGMKQRLAIASALLSDPEVMILDEPTNGLDPQGIAGIRQLILELAGEGRTILLASHLLDEVQKICSDFAVLRNGKKIYQGSVRDIAGERPTYQLEACDQVMLGNVLNNRNLTDLVELNNGVFHVKLSDSITIEMLHQEIIQAGIVLTHLEQLKNSLEQRFLEILNTGENV